MNKFILFLFFIIAIVLFANSKYLDSSNYKISQFSTQNVVDSVAKSLGTQRDKTFLSGPSKAQKSDTWWISDDNWSIWVPSVSTSVNVFAVNEINQNKTTFKKLNNAVRRAMDANGFKLNKQNSSSSESDEKYYDYIQAYEKDNIRCVATSSPDVGRLITEAKNYSQFSFGCFDMTQFQAAYDEQIPFLKILNERTEIVSDIQIKDGNKAQMQTHARRTGAAAFFYKSNNQWIEIMTAQAPTYCFKQSNVPRAFWISCYNTPQDAPSTDADLIKGWEDYL